MEQPAHGTGIEEWTRQDKACQPTRELRAYRPQKPPGWIRCPVKKKGCHLHRSCMILGGCLLQHTRVKRNLELLLALASAGPVNVKRVAKILEEDMPGLKRYNDRANFKPSEEDRELNDKLYGR